MGYAVVAELAHELETVLDRARRDDLAIDGDMMDLFFRSADVLEQAIEAAVAGRERRGAWRGTTVGGATLRALGAAPPPARTDGRSPSPATPGTLVRVRLAPDTPLRGVRAFIIVQAMGTVGEVTGTEPPLEELQARRLRRRLRAACRDRRSTPPTSSAWFAAPATSPTCRWATTTAGATPRHAAAAEAMHRRSTRSRRARASVRPAPARARHVRIDVRRLDTSDESHRRARDRARPADAARRRDSATPRSTKR